MAIKFSMVLFPDNPVIDVNEISNYFVKTWPEHGTPNNIEQTDNIQSFSVGDINITLGAMPRSLPWSELEGPCATSLLWPNAEHVLKSHQSHMIVTVYGELDPIPLSSLLTQATTAVLVCSRNALGVYWSDSTLIIPKPIFIDFALEILPKGPPIYIWVDFRVGSDAQNTSTGFTQGMEALGLMEIEAFQAPESVSELRERLVLLADYLAQNDLIVNDGDTIGGDEHEKIEIHYSKSKFGYENDVMSLSYIKDTTKKSWWRGNK